MTAQENKKFKEVEEKLSKLCNYREIPEHINLTPIERLMCYILFNVKNIARLNRGANIFTFCPQYKIGRFRVDFLCRYMDKEYIIECDGHDFHEKTKEQVIHDKRRERCLLATGRKVLRFSGTEILNYSVFIIKELGCFFESEYCNGYASYPENLVDKEEAKND